MSKSFILSSGYSPAGDQPEAIHRLTEGLSAGEAGLTLLGVTGSGKTFTIANVIEELQRPTLIMAHNKTLAAQLYGEMKAFFPENAVEYFVSYYDYYQPEAYVPASDTYIEKDASINDHIEQMRLSATKALLERPDTILVATVSAIYGLGDPQSYLGMVLHLSRGETVDQRQILRRLAELQYTRNDTELQRGTYRVRGEIIDIFPAESEREAVRVELFDDEIESLAYFDPLTGEVLARVPRLTVYPKTHYVTPRQTILESIDHIKEELKARLDELYAANKLVEAQRLEQRTRFDIEMMLELGYCSGIENYSRYLSGRSPGEPPPTLFDYLPDNALLVVDETHVTISQIGAMFRGDRSRKENLVTYGFRLPSALDNRPLKFEEFEQRAPQTIFVSATPGKYEAAHSGEVVEQVVRPTGLVDPELEVRPATTQVDDLLSEIRKRTANRERILVTTLTKKMAEDLTDYLEEHGAGSATCTPISIRWSGWRSSVICAWANSTCWWVSTCCAKVWICPKSRWSLFWMPIKKGFCVPKRHLSRRSGGPRAMCMARRSFTPIRSPAPCAVPSTKPIAGAQNRLPITKLTVSPRRVFKRPCAIFWRPAIRGLPAHQSVTPRSPKR